MLPFGQSSIHLWSSLWIRHLWLGIRSVSGSLRRHLMHLMLAFSGIYWAGSHTPRNLSCQPSASPDPKQTGFGVLWSDRGPWLLTNQLAPTVKIFLHSYLSFPLLAHFHCFFEVIFLADKSGTVTTEMERGEVSFTHCLSHYHNMPAFRTKREYTKKYPQTLPIVCNCITDKVMRTYASILCDSAFSSTA